MAVKKWLGLAALGAAIVAVMKRMRGREPAMEWQVTGEPPDADETPSETYPGSPSD